MPNRHLTSVQSARVDAQPLFARHQPECFPQEREMPLEARLWLRNREFAEAWPADGLVLFRLPFVVGRLPIEFEPAPASQVDLRVPDREPFQMSRVHYCILSSGGQLAVMDTNSHFGTTVNDVAIGRRFSSNIAYLRAGVNTIVVGIGKSRFRFELLLRAIS